MANPESGGLVEGYQNFNRLSRNIALGVAIGGAYFAPPLVVPALLWAGSDQAQIYAIDRYQGWRAKGGKIFP